MATSISAILVVTTAPQGVAPGPIATLTPSSVTSSSAVLTWSAVTSGDAPITYQVQQSPPGVPVWTSIGPVLPSTTMTETVTGLSPASTLQFQVLAINPSGQNSSPIVSVTTLAQLPGPPLSLALSSSTSTSATLTWAVPTSPPGTGNLSYTVGYRTPSGVGVFTAAPTVGVLFTTVTGLTPGATYDFEVAASNTAGTGPQSSILVGVTLPTGIVAPSAPQNPTVVTTTVSSATISWTLPAQVSGTVTYILQFRVSGTVPFTSAAATPSLSEVVSGLLNGTTYDFQILATNQGGTSPPSAIVAGTTGTAPPVLPSAPTALVLVLAGTTTLSFGWTASATGTALIQYQTQWSLAGQGVWTSGPLVSVASAQITGLTAGTSYDLRVQATNAAGQSAFAQLSAQSTLSAVTAVTWNSTGASPNISLSTSKLTVTAGGSSTPYSTPQACLTTSSLSTGKGAFQVVLSTITQNLSIALANSNFSFTLIGGAGSDTNAVAWYPSTGAGSQAAQTVYYNGLPVLSPPAGVGADTAGALVTVLIDRTAGTWWIQSPAMIAAFGAGAYNNAASVASGGTQDPANGKGGIPTGVTGDLFICFSTGEGGSVVVLNANSSPFVGSGVPANFPPIGGGSAPVVQPGQVTSLQATATGSTSASLSWVELTGTTPIQYTVQYRPHTTGFIFNDTFTSLSDITDSGGPPLKVTTITASPTGQSFNDGSGNIWSIVSGVALENGVSPVFSANVIQVSMVNGVVWSENSSFQWYSFLPGSPPSWNPGNNPLAGGTGGSWMNHYAFGGSEFTLSANGELEYFSSASRTGFSPFTLQSSGAGPGLLITVDTAVSTSYPSGHTPANSLSLPYNSGVIVSATETSGEPTDGLFFFTYGLIEVQCMFPAYSGNWPGVALYRRGGGSGELDVVEVGNNVTQAWGSIHSSTIGQSVAAVVTDWSVNRHIYAINWTATTITWLVDGVQYAQVATPPDFVGNAFYIAIDLAVQGNPGLGFDGVPTVGVTPFPQHMTLDFVRVSQGPTGPGQWITFGTSTTTSDVVTGLLPATQYDFQVQGSNSAGAGALSTVLTLTTAAASTVPGAPVGVSVVSATSSSLGVSWQAPTTGGTPTSYTVQYKLTTVSTYTNLASVTGTTATITGLVAATSYNVQVLATNSTGTGAVSSPAATGTTSATAPTGLTDPSVNPGQDGRYWKLPQQTTAIIDTTSASVHQLRFGSTSSSTLTGIILVKGNYSVPFVRGVSTDPLVRVTDGTATINVHIPLGTVLEEGAGATLTDSTIGGTDATQPGLMWSCSGAQMNFTSVQSSGTVITGTFAGALQIDWGFGPIMEDTVTGQLGNGNAYGSIQDLELTAARADVNYVVPHMLACQLSPFTQVNTTGPIWPLLVIDTNFSDPSNTGLMSQGQTYMIPASDVRPAGQTRGYNLLYDVLKHYGMIFYNVTGSGGTTITVYSTNPANAALVQDCINSFPTVMGRVGILTNQSGPSTAKGMVGGVRSDAFPPPPLLDLSGVGGVEVASSTVGAYYPTTRSGFSRSSGGYTSPKPA